MPYKDPEKKKEYNRKYRIGHKERINAKTREWHKANKHKSREYSKKYREKHKIHTSKYYFHVAKNYHLKKKYGITLEQYNNMLVDQNGVCHLCGRTNGDRSLAVDHNHKTGKVRRLLCAHCNYLVGTVESRQSEIDRIKEYLCEYN